MPAVVILLAMGCGRETKVESKPTGPRVTYTATTTAQPEGIDGEIRDARILSSVRPDFSQCSRGGRGTVVLSLIIGADGQVRNVHVVRSASECMDRQAVSAINAWTFCPAVRSGKPLEVAMTLTIKSRA